VKPALLSIDPAVGSSGGSRISVVGSGFGTATTGLNIAADGVELCASVNIASYGTFDCYTNAIEVAVGATITVTLNGVESTDSFVASDCIYSQNETITVSAVATSGNTVTFIGTGFLSAYTASASIGGISADSVTVTNETSATASWTTTGIPGIDATPVLQFTHSTGNYSHYATVSATFSKTHNVTATTSSLSCSFAGGCTYAIESEGLYATLQNSLNSVKVCGSTCTLREDLSTATSAVCEVPKLATTYSVDSYKINESVVLYGTEFPTGTVLYDSETIVPYEATESTECTFGMTFKEGHVAVLDEAKIFINFLTDKSRYVNKLQFQGSNDNWATHTLLQMFGEEIHEGWNYLNYREHGGDKPSYNSYRFVGNETNSCKITEFRLHGVEAIANEESTYSCTPKIYIGETELTTTTALNSITYKADATPLLTAISPRYGSVLGSTTVTLTGTNLVGTASATVLFDDRTCTVQTATATAITCITDDKPWVADTPRVTIEVEGLGLAAT
jgi:hypothetical protein